MIENIIYLVEKLAAIAGLDELCMTTNGVLLKDYVWQLKDAGLKRINISLDTLREDRYKSITRLGKLKEVMEGIELAQVVGFNQIKINRSCTTLLRCLLSNSEKYLTNVV